jgi:CheY-like chemotaxis protein
MSSKDTSDTGNIRLLYVEDDDRNRSSMEITIATHTGWELITSHSGEQGLEYAKLYRPNLVLMDIGLPGIDGIETTRRLRADPDLGHIPVIALTANPDLIRSDDEIRHLFDGVLAKPVDRDAMLSLVRSLIGGGRE